MCRDRTSLVILIGLFRLVRTERQGIELVLKLPKILGAVIAMRYWRSTLIFTAHRVCVRVLARELDCSAIWLDNFNLTYVYSLLHHPLSLRPTAILSKLQIITAMPSQKRLS